MRVLFLIQELKLPSSRVRVSNLIPDLEKLGIECEVLEYPRPLGKKLALYWKMRKFDSVFLQKKMPTPIGSWLISRFSKRLIYDFDDAVYARQDQENRKRSRTRKWKFDGIIKSADVIIAGNRILRESVGWAAAPCYPLPSSIELRGMPQRSDYPDSPVIQLGWIGGVNNLRYLLRLSAVLKDLAKRRDFELVIISGRTVEIEGVRVRFVPWSEASQNESVARLDIGLMPLPDDEHTRGKCGYKALQYMAAGVPPVVSDVGVNGEIVRDGDCGFVVPTEDAFGSAMERLMDDPILRRSMGQRARTRVAEGFTVEQVAQQLADILKGTSPDP